MDKFFSSFRSDIHISRWMPRKKVNMHWKFPTLHVQRYLFAFSFTIISINGSLFLDLSRWLFLRPIMRERNFFKRKFFPFVEKTSTCSRELWHGTVTKAASTIISCFIEARCTGRARTVLLFSKLSNALRHVAFLIWTTFIVL